jgi:phosphohistidine phosphatase
MNELYVVRHGIAVEPGTSGVAEDDRPLTPKGRMRMRQIACALRRLELDLDRIVTSPLARARATAEIVAEELGLVDLLENSDVLQVGTAAATIKRWLRQRSEDRMMIVGHNPTLSELVSLLVLGSEQPRICDLKKGGIAALTRTAATKDLYDVLWIATPGVIRRLAKREGDSEK